MEPLGIHSHQKASHRWHCSVLNSARWKVLMRRRFSCEATRHGPCHTCTHTHVSNARKHMGSISSSHARVSVRWQGQRLRGRPRRTRAV
jgi:hypothetical protein